MASPWGFVRQDRAAPAPLNRPLPANHNRSVWIQPRQKKSLSALDPFRIYSDPRALKAGADFEGTGRMSLPVAMRAIRKREETSNNQRGLLAAVKRLFTPTSHALPRAMGSVHSEDFGTSFLGNCCPAPRRPHSMPPRFDSLAPQFHPDPLAAACSPMLGGPAFPPAINSARSTMSISHRSSLAHRASMPARYTNPPSHTPTRILSTRSTYDPSADFWLRNSASGAFRHRESSSLLRHNPFPADSFASARSTPRQSFSSKNVPHRRVSIRDSSSHDPGLEKSSSFKEQPSRKLKDSDTLNRVIKSVIKEEGRHESEAEERHETEEGGRHETEKGGRHGTEKGGRHETETRDRLQEDLDSQRKLEGQEAVPSPPISQSRVAQTSLLFGGQRRASNLSDPAQVVPSPSAAATLPERKESRKLPSGPTYGASGKSPGAVTLSSPLGSQEEVDPIAAMSQFGYQPMETLITMGLAAPDNRPFRLDLPQADLEMLTPKGLNDYKELYRNYQSLAGEAIMAQMRVSVSELQFYRLRNGGLQPAVVQNSQGHPRLLIPSTRDSIETGSCGVVFKGVIRGKQVAVKVIHPDALEADKIGAVDKMAHEARVLLKVGQHEGIVKLLGIHMESFDNLWLITDLSSGVDLQVLVSKAQVRLDVMARYNAILSLASALSYLHSPMAAKGVVAHRDVKPENILVSKESLLTLCDFGNAEVSLDGHFRRLRGVTWLYAPPEVISLDIRSIPASEYLDVGGTAWDMWSFGCVLCELLDLAHPFRHHNNLGPDPEDYRTSFLAKIKEGRFVPALTQHVKVGIEFVLVHFSFFRNRC